MKKLLSLFLSCFLILGTLFFVAFAAGSNVTLKAESVSGKPGDTVQVNINLLNNTGLSSLMFKVSYGSILTLTNVELGGDFSNKTTPPSYTNPQTLSFLSPTSDVKTSGTVATLTFKISETASAGQKADVTLAYNPDDVFDVNLDNVSLTVVNGVVTVESKECSHNYVGSITVPATCTNEGKKTFVCSKCNDSYVEAIPATDHTVVTDPEVSPTCTTAGKTKGSHCSVCNTVIIPQTVQKALGHTGGVANCVDKAVCTRCHCAYGSVNAANHKSIVTDRAVAATCTKTGKTAGKHCSACSVVITAQKTVAKLSHTYATKTTAATTETDGKIVTACTECGTVSKTSKIYKASAIKLSAVSYTYDGKAKAPSVTVQDSKGKTLVRNTDYTVSYASGRTNPGRYAVAVKLKGNYTGTKTLYFDILPGMTSKFTATQTTNAIKLTWNAVSKATGYRVYLYNTKTKKYQSLATTTKNTYTVTKLTAGTDYIFAVRAYSTVDGKVFWASGFKTIATATKPNTPTLKATAGTRKVTLSWNKQAGADGYVVYMATSKNGKYTKIATVKGNAKLSFTKTGLTKGKTYYFKVAAYSTVGGKNIYSSFSSVKYAKVK